MSFIDLNQSRSTIPVLQQTRYKEKKMTKNSAKILIVDDMKANRNALRSFVNAFGYTPILAEDGLMALEKLKEQAVDLVLLDIMMPGIDGYEVLSHI